MEIGNKKIKKIISSRVFKKNIFVISMLLIPVAHFIVFWCYVNFNSILMAFQRYNIYEGGSYFTLNNFKALDTYVDLKIGFLNTLLTFGLMLFILQWGFFVTYFLYKNIALSKLWRTFLFIPSILPIVAMTSIFKYIISPVGGPVQEIWQILFGSRIPSFLASKEYARWTILFYIFWTNFGGQFIVFSGAMTRIPKEVIESAHLDGAGMWTELLKLIFPLCWSTFSMLLLLNISGLFMASGPILLLTGGAQDTMTVSFWIFYNVQAQNLNEPAALGLICTVILFPIVILSRFLLGKVYADVEF